MKKYIKYLKIIVASLVLTMVISVGGAAANGVSPSQSLPTANILADSFVGTACSALTTVSSTSCTGGSNSFKGIAREVVNILSYIIGIVSVIMIIIAGFRFVIGGNDTNAVQSAKSTLIYALVGLAIAILAQFLVHSVLNTANNIQNGSFNNSGAPINRDS